MVENDKRNIEYNLNLDAKLVNIFKVQTTKSMNIL